MAIDQMNTVVYYCGTMPVFSHAVGDWDSFRMIVRQLYVNRGLGTVGAPIRLGARAEVSVLKLCGI